MSELFIKKLVLGMVRTNCYIARNKETGEAIVIDTADDAAEIIQAMKQGEPGDQFACHKQCHESNGLVCQGILLTHGHFDHIMAAKELSGKTGAKIYAQEAEAGLLADKTLNEQIRRRVS